MLAIAIAMIVFAIYSYRHRFVRTDADMLGLLPGGNATTFFVNVAALRHAGILNLLSGSKPITDPEYRDFVRETHFDYAKNLDAVAGETTGEQVFFILRGNFDWRRLREYSAAHGGSCRNGDCNVPASRAGRWASFYAIQPNVMALALSANSSAAEMLRRDKRRVLLVMRSEPVWVNVSPSLLKNPSSLPVEMRIFAISLQSANSAVLSLGRAAENSGTAFNIQLDAECPSEVTAEITRNQLDIQTKMLKLELARERQRPNPADLTGLLTAGTFRVVSQHVIGTWPVRKELLKALE